MILKQVCIGHKCTIARKPLQDATERKRKQSHSFSVKTKGGLSNGKALSYHKLQTQKNGTTTPPHVWLWQG